MTDGPTDMPDAPAIPGLELPELSHLRLTGTDAELTRAVDLTLAHLIADHSLDLSRDAARIALARELGAVIALKRSSGKVSTVGNDARVLLELLDGMVPTEAASSADAALAQAMREWSAQVKSMEGKA